MMRRKTKTSRWEFPRVARRASHGEMWPFPSFAFWTPTGYHEAPGPDETGVSTFPDIADAQITHQVEVHIILEQVEALDDVLVVHEAQEHDLGRNPTVNLVIPPRVLGHLVLDNELHGDLVALCPVARSHHEPVTASAQLVLEMIVAHKVDVQ